MTARAIYEPKGAAREYAALACNLYRGCTHGCTYCYAPACLRKKPEDFHAAGTLRPGIIEALTKDAPKYADRGDPVLFCFTCDPYQPSEREATRTALQIMRDAGCPFTVLTKAGLLACRDFDLYGPRDSFGTSLSFTEAADAAQWEPNAASLPSRGNAIIAAREWGIRTWVSIEPVIDPEQALRVIELTHIKVDEFRVGKLNHHPLAASINWAKFAADAVTALQATGRYWIIKDALAAYLPVGTPRSYKQGEPE